jgi:hypothetical protein
MLRREIGEEPEEEFVVVDEQQLPSMAGNAAQGDGFLLDGIPADPAVRKEMCVVEVVKGLPVCVAVGAKMNGALHGDTASRSQMDHQWSGEEYSTQFARWRVIRGSHR